jgi:flavin-dependent dehydrogenase
VCWDEIDNSIHLYYNATMHEVIVVGAGPAGSIAAAVLAKQGRQVLLLDKAEFPRDKVCGDGIGWNSIRLGAFP